MDHHSSRTPVNSHIIILQGYTYAKHSKKFYTSTRNKILFVTRKIIEQDAFEMSLIVNKHLKTITYVPLGQSETHCPLNVQCRHTEQSLLFVLRQPRHWLLHFSPSGPSRKRWHFLKIYNHCGKSKNLNRLKTIVINLNSSIQTLHQIIQIPKQHFYAF